MSLFVVQHKHPAAKCPAGDPQMGQMLLKHLSKQNATSAGVHIHAEAVVDGAHALVLIVGAADKGKVEKFMAPFAMAGAVEVLPASPCEIVVDRGKC